MVKQRIASLSDLKHLQKFFCDFRDVLGPQEPDDAAISKNLRHLLERGESDFLLVVNDAEEAIGLVQQRYRFSLWLSGLEATQEDLYVSPEYRGRGIGTHLVEFAIERAREKGCRLIKLDTNEDNRSAVNLYRKLGFSSGSSRFVGSRQLMFSKTLCKQRHP